ncbi:MAG TPA: hypothetical protein VMZ66_02380 [Aeromicrobium sp.]|nr:hypothetical protein [Aeromicrobium sp.]
MNEWLIQIFAVSDASAQELITGLLGGFDDVAARAATNGPDHFVVTECGDPMRARAVFRLLTSVDVHASVVHTSNGSIEQSLSA